MFLYVITNCCNGKQYVGITINPKLRWKAHKTGGRQGSRLVAAAIRKYGIQNFKFDILHEGSEQEIKALEIQVIQALDSMVPNGYNLSAGGEGSWGWHPDKETRKRMSDAGKRRPHLKHSSETCKILSQKARDRPLTEERLATLRKNAGKRGTNPNARPLTINGKYYACIQDAADTLKVNRKTIRAFRDSGKETYTPKTNFNTKEGN